MDNVIRLPRPKSARDQPHELGFYLRVGRDQHLTVMNLLAEGERRFFGLIIEATNVHRHRELRVEARKRGVDIILDPKTQAWAMPGGHTSRAAALPWGLDRPHRTDDFSGADGRAQVERLIMFAVKNEFTQLLGPTHYLQSHSDPWLGVDIESMRLARNLIDAHRADLELIYSLCVPMETLREPAFRRSLIESIKHAPFDALWLKVDNFGADASGEKVVAYVEACQDFHVFGVPLIGDHVGGLPGLGILAFGAVGGIAHGITMYEGFKSYSWRKPQPKNSGRVPPVRVYIPKLDMHLEREQAKILFDASSRIKGRFGCTDTHCCNGIRGQLEHPARHFVHQRSRELTEISGLPDTLRVGRYLDEFVRKVSDDVAGLCAADGLPKQLQKRLQSKQATVGKFRASVVNLAEANRLASQAKVPQRLEVRKHGKR